jgi:hypothetical protein
MSRHSYIYNRLDTDGSVIDSGTCKFYNETYGFHYSSILDSAKYGRLIRKSFRFAVDTTVSVPVKVKREKNDMGKEVPLIREYYVFPKSKVRAELVYQSGKLIKTKFL